MGLFDFFKNKSAGVEKQYTENGNAYWVPKPISAEEYEEKRNAEIAWLESHYDLTSARGIMSIPERDNLPRPTLGDSDGFRSYTGDIDYYLRAKSAQYEEAGNIELAILCLRKSNAIRMVARRGYRKDDYYSLVRLLARNGYVQEATIEKSKIDVFFGENIVDTICLNGREQANKIIKSAYELGTGLLIMQAHECACSECAKYQGRVFSIYGTDSRFPPLPEAFYEYGAIHKGCRHSFFPYVDGFSDPGLDYTLSIQKAKNPNYRKSIIAFSNRPFIDDRPEEDINEALERIEKEKIETARKKDLEDHMIEREAKRGTEKREYKWIQENLPEICPKSFSGYKRMKNSNTKNFQKIVAEANRLGRNID